MCCTHCYTTSESTHNINQHETVGTPVTFRPPVEQWCLGMAAPDAIILSGPDFYEAHLTRLYGGYKRTQNLYGRATYQKDPAQVDAERNDAYIYFSLADRKPLDCIGCVVSFEDL